MSAALTPRQREVCTLVTQGLTGKQIAIRLGVSYRTVEAHREAIFTKYGVRNAAELTRVVVTGEFMNIHHQSEGQ